MASFRGIPISILREHYAKNHRNEMFSSMITDVLDGHSGILFHTQSPSSEQQQHEPRIWELNDSDEESSPTEEEKQKKKNKNRKKYLRKKERVQAARVAGEQKDGVEDVEAGVAGLAVHDPTPALIEECKDSSVDANTATLTPTQPKLSKRQKKTLLKKAKQAQDKTKAPESIRFPGTVDYTSDSRALNNEPSTENDNEETKVSNHGHKKSEHEDKHKDVATESEVEAVLETVAKRFGQ
ncbi:hypothetical protein E4T48_06663 [Aureobasidium sp. EXF-10727]|nr:hypothetical protein E4T48_06663 [Aureobasidium sp. EXF-10727]